MRRLRYSLGRGGLIAVALMVLCGPASAQVVQNANADGMSAGAGHRYVRRTPDDRAVDERLESRRRYILAASAVMFGAGVCEQKLGAEELRGYADEFAPANTATAERLANQARSRELAIYASLYQAGRTQAETVLAAGLKCGESMAKAVAAARAEKNALAAGGRPGMPSVPAGR